jgi:hypothetical protein
MGRSAGRYTAATAAQAQDSAASCVVLTGVQLLLTVADTTALPAQCRRQRGTRGIVSHTAFLNYAILPTYVVISHAPCMACVLQAAG